MTTYISTKHRKDKVTTKTSMRRIYPCVEDPFWHMAYEESTDRQVPHVSSEIVLARVLRHTLRAGLLEDQGLVDTQPRVRELIVHLERDDRAMVRLVVAPRLQYLVDAAQSMTDGCYLLRRCLWLLDEQVSTYDHRRTWREIFRALGSSDILLTVIEDVGF